MLEEEFTDVVLMVDAFAEAKEVPDPLPGYFDEDVTLSGDLFLGPLLSLRRDLLDACDPRGINWEPPTKAYPVNFVIGRRAAPGHPWNFDPDRRLWTCIQLSRLVQPTSLGFDRAGRLQFDGDGKLLAFAPSRIGGCPGRGWVADLEHNWFADRHIEEIRLLVESFDADTLPERVLQALWHHEHAHQMHFVDVRWPLIAIGLESLIHTDRHGSTRQFVRRLLLIQQSRGIDLADEDLLRLLYDRRSSLAHGQRLGELDEITRSHYIVLETLLRSLVTRAILDADFAAYFADADTVREAWPI